MAIRHVNVAIRRDELTTIKTSVAEWEVPLLHLVHGEGAVTELEGEPWADVDPPNVNDEYRRLQARYKTPANEDGSPGQAAVALVYGPFGASALLAQAIQNATFERPVDLLGIDTLRANAAAATEAANKANAALASAQAAETEDENDEGEETPAEKAAREKRERAAAAKAAKAAAAAGSTTGKSLL